MSKDFLRRRAAMAVLVVAIALVPVLGAGGASADTIADKRAEAARIADQLDALQMKAEIAAENYNNARIELSSVDAKEQAAEQKVARTDARLAAQRRQMAGYAIDAYVRGGTGDGASAILGAQDSTELPARRGYIEATTNSGGDVVDHLRAAQADANADTTALRAARVQVAKVKAKVDAQRQAANAAVDAQQKILSKVNGELDALLKAEQARRAAAAAAAARAAQARLAAEQAAYAAAHPHAAHVSRPAAHTNTAGADPSSTDPTTADTGSSSGSSDTGSSGNTSADPPVGQGADAAIAAAQSVLGVRYTWGGASPSGGFDCSGLVMWAWEHGGVSLPHSSAAMYSSSRRIPLSEMEPGDLVFYGSPVHHVALYIGGGQIIHAPHTWSYVQVASVYYWSDVVGAGRV